MKQLRTYYLLALAWSICGCMAAAQHEKEAPLAETATFKVVSAGKAQWAVQYLPTAFHIMRAQKSNPGLTAAQKDSVAEQYYPFYYFRTSVKGDQSVLTKEKLQYLNYGMEHDFVMVMGIDTILPYMSQAIATGNASANEFMLVFPRIDTTAALPLKIVFNDHVYGSGQTYCVFNSNDLKDQ